MSDTKLTCVGQGCSATLVRATAWTPALMTLRKVTGRIPSVGDLSKHVHCGKCAAQGRKAGIRFFRHDATVMELEKRRIEQVAQAKNRFAHYLR